MSGYISDTSLTICQSVIQNHVSLLKLIGSCDREQLECVLDELNSALSGEPLEQVRKQRKELERIDQEEWEKIFGAKKEKSSEESNEPLHGAIDQFVSDCLEIDPSCYLSLADAYDAWSNWRKDKRVMNISYHSFVRELKVRRFVIARRFHNSRPLSRDLVGMRLK